MDRERYMTIMKLIAATDQGWSMLKTFKEDISRIAGSGPNGSDEDKAICMLCAWWCQVLLLGK